MAGAGNRRLVFRFCQTIFDLLDLNGAVTARRLADTMAYAALSCLPPLTLHAQMRLWQWLDDNARPQYLRWRIVLCYLPLLALPYSLSFLWRQLCAASRKARAVSDLVHSLDCRCAVGKKWRHQLVSLTQNHTTREQHFFKL
ncbi:MAG: hypothetical protein U0Y68_25045 [Blastocatellia bacterium]